MKISKKAQYGLRAMVFLAKKAKGSNQSQKAFSIREISNEEGMPFAFLSKIFADLERAGLVKAKHGMNGGYVLSKKPSQITAGQVVSFLENADIAGCKICSKARKCRTKSVWNRVEQVISSTLDKITLQNLVSGIAD